MRTSSLQNRPVHRHHSQRAFKVQFIGGGAHSGANLMADLVWKKHGVQGVIGLSTSNYTINSSGGMRVSVSAAKTNGKLLNEFVVSHC